MRTIAIVNQKGGCGKTTTAINLAAALAERGRRTLLIDVDPQSHCAAGLAVPEDKIDLDIGDALRAPVDKKLDHTRLLWRIGKNLDLAPSRTRLAGIEAPNGGLADQPEREFRLARVIERLAATAPYDFCIIDCPPTIGLLTYNALAAGREVIVPVETSYFSLLGAKKQLRTVKSIGRRLGMRHHVRFLATIHDPSRALARDLYAELKREFTDQVFESPIRFDPAVPEALSFGRPILEYQPHGVGATDHRELATSVLEVTPPRRGLEPVAIADDDDDRADDQPIHQSAHRADEPPRVEVARSAVPRFQGRGLAPAPAPQPVAALAASAPLPADLTPQPAPAPAHARTSTLTPASTAPSAPLHTPAPVAAAPVVTVPVPAAPVSTASEPLPPRYRLLAANGPMRLIEDTAVPRASALTTSPYGAKAAGRRIVFIQPIELGRSVAIAATFNNWDPVRHVMRRNPEMGIHELAIDVPPGRHAYRLVVDGRWTDDPHATDTQPNEFGGRDAIVLIEPA